MTKKVKIKKCIVLSVKNIEYLEILKCDIFYKKY